MDTKTQKHVEQLDEFEPIELGSVSEETKGGTIGEFEDLVSSKPDP